MQDGIRAASVEVEVYARMILDRRLAEREGELRALAVARHQDDPGVGWVARHIVERGHPEVRGARDIADSRRCRSDAQLDLHEAQREIASNWDAAYVRYVGA